jgi:hypothetical protein
MIGTLINARMIPPFNMFTPTGVPVTSTINLLITVNPMNPHTTLGIAANSSMTIFSVSRNRGPQNSDMNIAAPNPNGTAMTMASAVTLNEPTVNAQVPYRTFFAEVGYHSALNKNSPRLNPSLPKIGNASRNTKRISPEQKIPR